MHIYTWEGDVNALAGEESWEDSVPAADLDFTSCTPV